MLGDLDAAEARFEHAFALGCQVGDPCWESIALRGLGSSRRRAATRLGLELLVDAPSCAAASRTRTWIEAYGLDALCAVAVEHRVSVVQWINELEGVAARRGIRELVPREPFPRACSGSRRARRPGRWHDGNPASHYQSADS